MNTEEFFDLLTEKCTYCEDGTDVAPAYGNSWMIVECGVCRGSQKMPSEVGKELLRFIKQYGSRRY